MKRFARPFLSVILCLLLAGSALSAAGTQQDPVVSLSYLDAVFLPKIEAEADAAVLQQLNSAYNAAFSDLADVIAGWNQDAIRADSVSHALEGTLILKQGDAITLAPGCQIVLRSGSAKTDGANLICVTDGAAVAAGASLATGKLYMKNHLDAGGFTVTSETAEVYFSGVATRRASTSVDYGSLADALSTMKLFLGTGNSYALQTTANRAEGLVMFLRLLGLEDEALAYTGSCPFTDVKKSDWFYPYVSYAYSKGLTEGTSATTFHPRNAVTAQQYLTFLMRALRYEEGTDFTYNTVLQDCVRDGLFQSQEISTMSSGAFLRCKMVYLSYYGLFAPTADTSRMLISELVASGTVSVDTMRAGICRAASLRLG